MQQHTLSVIYERLVAFCLLVCAQVPIVILTRISATAQRPLNAVGKNHYPKNLEMPCVSRNLVNCCTTVQKSHLKMLSDLHAHLGNWNCRHSIGYNTSLAISGF